jgi:hypothetical protein
MVLPSEDLTNNEDDDAGKTGIADDTGRERERCGIGGWELTGSNSNTGLGARVDCCMYRDKWVDMGLEDLLQVRECTACTSQVINQTGLTKLGWTIVQ